jgi:hypothetical protein
MWRPSAKRFSVVGTTSEPQPKSVGMGIAIGLRLPIL